MITKDLYVVSDIHGHYDALISSLESAGFDETNENHLLIVIGDIFDRGTQSKEVYKYIRRLVDSGKAIFTKGNHDNMFIEFLRGEDSWFNFIYNGMKNTFDDFNDRTASFESFIVLDKGYKELLKIPEETFDILWKEYQENTRQNILKEFPDILDWFERLPDYLETKNYIFTHASIDANAKDWHNPEHSKHKYVSWDACHWDDGSFFGEELKNIDKKIVVGHYHTDGIREKYNIDYDGTNKILVRDDGKITMIDTCTPITKRVNVLIIYNEELL